MADLFTRRTAAFTVLLFLFLALTLYLMGRKTLCDCGIGLWTSSAWSPETSQLFADPYSLSHLLHGLLFYGGLHVIARKLPVQHRLVLALLIEAAWELFENTPFIINKYRHETASLNYFGDSVLNSLGDMIFMWVGFFFAYRFSWKWTISLFILIELLMLVTIRDNLTLNVIMLIHPVELIQKWQMAT